MGDLASMRRKYHSWQKQGKCPQCGRPPAKNERLCSKHLEISRRSSLRYVSKLRDAAYAHYGGYVCACCGEKEKMFLTLDHIDGGGSAHRKKMGTKLIYKWLQDNDYPPGFQVLCQNCNVGKWRNGGVCPHQSK